MGVQPFKEVKMVPTLGLTGVTINAMALIAPGAFLWTTYQLQAAPSSAMNMWASVFVATAIAMLTAVAYAALANRYPDAGSGSSYFFAEASVLQQEEHRHFKFARLSKFIVGWASHLYYWIYPGVMVAFMGLLITYIIQTFVPSFGTPWQEVLVCVAFAVLVGIIAYVGVTGSTMANIVINVIQILALVFFSALAIIYRIQHPKIHYLHPNALSVIQPHDLSGLFFQSTIAILLVVGFESATALAAESKNPQRDIPRGVLLSLVIQAVVFYFIEYFAANFFINKEYTYGTGKDLVRGFDAASASSAPIGDMAKILGNTMLHGNGQALMIILAISVLIALVGTALSCLNTGVRVTYAMGKDSELPVVFGFLHGKYRTPHAAIIVLTIISAAIGGYGVLNVDNLTQVTLISNIGTFLLYGMTCIICVIAFLGVAGRNILTTAILPVLGAILNGVMLVGVIFYAIVGGGSTQTDTIIAGVFSLAWLVIGFGFLFMRKLIQGTPILHPPDHKEGIEPSMTLANVTDITPVLAAPVATIVKPSAALATVPTAQLTTRLEHKNSLPVLATGTKIIDPGLLKQLQESKPLPATDAAILATFVRAYSGNTWLADRLAQFAVLSMVADPRLQEKIDRIIPANEHWPRAQVSIFAVPVALGLALIVERHAGDKEQSSYIAIGVGPSLNDMSSSGN